MAYETASGPQKTMEALLGDKCKVPLARKERKQETEDVTGKCYMQEILVCGDANKDG